MKKLGFFKKMMLNMIKKSLEKKEAKTADELRSLEALNGADHTSKEAIEDIVGYCK